MEEFNRLIDIFSERDDLIQKRYSIFNPEVLKIVQEKERLLVRLINKENIYPLETKKLLEIGCAKGIELLYFIRLGIRPENITAVELIENWAASASSILPKSATIIHGNALNVQFPENHFDIVYQSLVFSSILQDALRIELANLMWKVLKLGGGILWYDFVYNNPKNLNVRKVDLKEIRALFPDAKIKYWRLTLAPPIGRMMVKIHPCMYDIFNSFPFFRTHLLCWIQKES